MEVKTIGMYLPVFIVVLIWLKHKDGPWRWLPLTEHISNVMKNTMYIEQCLECHTQTKSDSLSISR